MRRFRKEMLAKRGLKLDRRGLRKLHDEQWLLDQAHTALPEQCKFRHAAITTLKDAAWFRKKALEVHRMSERSRAFDTPFMPRRYGMQLIRTKSDWISYLAESARVELAGTRAQRLAPSYRDSFTQSTSTP